MESNNACPKCSGAMVEGFTFDQSGGSVFVNTWVEGAPEKSFLHGINIQGKRWFQVSTFRCEKCGYLESYARDEIDH